MAAARETREGLVGARRASTLNIFGIGVSTGPVKDITLENVDTIVSRTGTGGTESIESINPDDLLSPAQL